MNTVYTYYQQINIIDNDKRRKSSQNDLIDICEKSWKLNGWKLIVLEHKDAKKHPFYDEYDSIIRTLPSVNPIGYDYHCYMRWLAMAQIGGGVMIDYDVMNLSLKNDEIFRKQNTLSIFQNHVPCVVFGTSDQYLEACNIFCDMKNYKTIMRDTPHVSDMMMIEKGFNDTSRYSKIKYVSDYPEEAPLIHCSQYHCLTNQTTKIEAMKSILAKIQ